MSTYPLILSFIVFTIKDKSIDQNEYLQMLLCCWNTLILFGNVKQGDTILLFIDSPSFDFLKNNDFFISLIDSFKNKKINVEYRVKSQPETLLEGCLWRYEIFSYNFDKIIPLPIVYIDIDNVCVKPIDKIRSLLYSNKGFLILPENPLSHTNYSDIAIPQEFLNQNPNLPGCSSGLFGFNLSNEECIYFQSILNSRLLECNYQQAGYCIDQPYFNYALWTFLLKKNTLNISFLSIDREILFNDSDLRSSPECIFINLAGNPGNGTTHLMKWLFASHSLLQKLVLEY